MRGKVWNRIVIFCKQRGRQTLYYACLTAVLCAAAVCAERTRNENPAEAQTASAETVETVTPEPTQTPPMLPGNAQILRGFAAKPQWNEWLGLYETHFGTDVHIDGGKVVSVSDGTVCGIGENWMEITSDEIVYFYRGIEPAQEITAGEFVQTGEILGSENNAEEGWMQMHVHLEARKDGNRIDLMGNLVKNVY